MATNTSSFASRESVARTAEGLGWFSLGLGVPQLLVPGLVNRIAGLRDDADSRTAQRVVGVRELAAAAGILGTRPTPWLWARVGGDAMDLALLGRAWAGRHDSTLRLLAATASIVGVTAIDLLTAMTMTNDPTAGRRPTTKTAAVTLDVPMEEAEAAWSALSADREAPAGIVTFRRAPGNTGTEVHLRVEQEGPVVDVARKAIGTEPYQRAQDALRRFKQLVESGEIARSDAMPEGESHQHVFPRQRPAQPLEHVPV